jgi:micrococcal nuclease
MLDQDALFAMLSQRSNDGFVSGCSLQPLLAASPALLATAQGPVGLRPLLARIHDGTIAKIEPNLDIALGDGRVLTLVWLDPPRDTLEHPRLAADAREKLAAWPENREAAVRALAENPTASAACRRGSLPRRWVRFPARSGSPRRFSMPASRATAPMPPRIPAASSFLAAEAEARTAQIGLWADPAYAVLPASDQAAFATPRTGVVLVEGTPTSLGETATRFYLSFGARRGSDFAITLPKRGANGLEKAGIKVQDLVGRRLRVRGLLDATFGPQIELTDPDGLELLD